LKKLRGGLRGRLSGGKRFLGCRLLGARKGRKRGYRLEGKMGKGWVESRGLVMVDRKEE